ncbi:MAG: MmgE/PrpD family protein, partial [Burkholderiaceae bacterium]|nr:MmgE/PrpD family protein [Burkholderiaceae bacterium]
MTNSSPRNPTRPAAAILADFAAGLQFDHLPAAVLSRAKLLILDALGCGLAANAYDFADTSVASIQTLSEATIGAPANAQGCSIVGRDLRLPVRDAALANGML